MSIEIVFPSTEAMEQVLARAHGRGTEPGRQPDRCHPRRRNYPALDPEESRCDHVNQPTNDKLSEKESSTMKLTTTTQVSVDGVMQGPGGPDENRRGGFERGGWAHFDNEAATFVDQVYQRADAFLFGRRTYEIFAGSWGTWPDGRGVNVPPARPIRAVLGAAETVFLLRVRVLTAAVERVNKAAHETLFGRIANARSPSDATAAGLRGPPPWLDDRQRSGSPRRAGARGRAARAARRGPPGSGRWRGRAKRWFLHGNYGDPRWRRPGQSVGGRWSAG
jgi:hypothetical protein